MRLSALDVKKKDFQQKMRGFDPDEVQAHLNQASEEIEQLTRERKETEEKLSDTKRQLDHYLALEQTLERTLSAAQQTAVKMEDQAKREAELILKDADLERSRKLNDIRIDLDRAQMELIRVKAEYQSMLSRMKAVMSGFSTFVQSLEQEAAPPNNYAPASTQDIASVLDYKA